MTTDTSKLLTNAQIRELAVQHGYEYRVLQSIIQVESGQHGFHPVTGKLIIQFEPAWFRRLHKHRAADTQHTTWQSNRVGDQSAEWKAFNSAFAVNADAAMKSTSIGMMQLMGFHYAETGFTRVAAFWDFAKVSERNQVLLALRWIKTVRPLDEAIKMKDWPTIARYYNGANYRAFNYDVRLQAAYRLAGD